LIVLLGIFAGYVTTTLFGLLGILMTFAIVYFYARWLKKAFLDDVSSSSNNNKIGMRYDHEQHKHLRFSPFKFRCARCKSLTPAVARECQRCGSKQKYAEFCMIPYLFIYLLFLSSFLISSAKSILSQICKVLSLTYLEETT
jgi:hypothetical protein